MELSVREAAVVLGKSERMVRHLAQTGKIPCKRSGGRWVFDREALVASSPEQAARHAQEAGVIRERLEAAVRSAAPPASGAPPREAWYSVRTMRAFTQADEALASIEDLVEQRPEAGPPLVGASTALRDLLRQVTDAAHQFHPKEKIARLLAARSSACHAVADLLHARRRCDDERLDAIAATVERDVLRSIAGLLRRAERRTVP